MTNHHATVHLLAVPIDMTRQIESNLPQDGYRIVSHPDAFSLVDNYQPKEVSVVLLYNWSDGQDSLDLIRRLTDRPIPARVILLVTQANVSIAARAAKSGAEDVIMSEEPIAKITNLIRYAIDCDSVERPRMVEVKEQLDRIVNLSDGERSVLQLMLTGDSNKVIAKRLDVSQRTVESRRQKVFLKTGTGSLPALSWACAKLAKHLDFLRADQGHSPVRPPSPPRTGKTVDGDDLSST